MSISFHTFATHKFSTAFSRRSGVNGFNAFYPEDILNNDVAPRVTASLRYEDTVLAGEEISVPSGVKNFSIDDGRSYGTVQKGILRGSDAEIHRARHNYRNVRSGRHFQDSEQSCGKRGEVCPRRCRSAVEDGR